MRSIEKKFSELSTDHAPGQEVRQGEDGQTVTARDYGVPGAPVDFSHGDVNITAFAPTPGALDAFIKGVEQGGTQAYTEYRGDAELRLRVAAHLADFTGRSLSGANELIFTPGTQSALFLAVAATVTDGDKVAIVRPDYFANRKLVQFFGGEVLPVRLEYLGESSCAGLDLGQLEEAFKMGAKTFLFSNPNNPAGVVYSPSEIDQIAALSNRYGVTVIVDQLYSRQIYSGVQYTHLRAADIDPDRIITIMGPSKTESLSGYRLGAAFGSGRLVDRMEKLQAIASLRAPGYCQAVFRTWFEEPEGWLKQRIVQHQAIRDELLKIFRSVSGVTVRAPEGGSYLFPRLPKMSLGLHDFIRDLRLRAAVTVTPGTEFSPDAGDSIRLNFSQNHAAAADAAERIIRHVKHYRV